MSRTAEVVIIGGGINGCSTAFRLAKDGVKNIVLIEKGHIASGPTGRSSGVVRQHYTLETLAAMARDSVRVWHNFAEEVGGEAGFVNAGVVFFCGPADAAALQQTIAMHNRLGIRESLLSADELRAMEPHLSADDIACGAYEVDGGYADPALAANSYCEAAQRLGVEVMKKTEVTALCVERGRMTKVITNKGEISTPVVVNIAGPWGSEIAAMVGVEIPIRATRHPVVNMQRPVQWRGPTPVWGDLVTGWYFKPERHVSMMTGSIHEDEKESVNKEEFSNVPSYDEIDEYSAAILKRFPVMAEGAAQGGWAALYDVTPDWQPVIDRIPEVAGFYCAVGFSGHGFKIAPAVGTIMSELVREGCCRSYDISLFRYGRHQRGELNKGAYEFGIIG
ncbi:MAG: FAD-dependent oxidoreductase [Blastocatellia bacterium]